MSVEVSSVKWLKAGLPVLVLLLGAGSLLVFGQRTEPETREPTGSSETAVETASAELIREPFPITIDGEAISYRSIKISAEVDGRVINLPKTSRGGRFVREGDLLLEIDPTDYQIAVDRLNAQVQQAAHDLDAVAVDIAGTQAMVKLADEQLEIMRRDLKRAQQLYSRSAGSEREVDTARQAELAARNSHQTLQNQLAALRKKEATLTSAKQIAETQLRQAEADLKRTRITAPVSGTVVGELVNQGEFVRMGDPLIRISESARMEVKCNLKIPELKWIWLQDQAGKQTSSERVGNRLELPQVPVEVVFEVDGIQVVWDGVLSRYEGVGLDTRTRTVPCRVLVEHPEASRVEKGLDQIRQSVITPPALLSGMYVTVRIPITSPLPLLKLPITAYRPGGFVWVVRDGKLHILKVQLARTSEDFVLVEQRENGLQDGDAVVVSPLASVTEGLPVKILNSPADEAGT
ncbi:efflux RND transporter periplasmic adaptor subunit [Thalassoroseus pseudoceratinae]|uniref:efflux RND transporter periplasmic adaptor subunit n=1 Tax=Thalassoroseus pseudoceratinae TaxID=2713176 RepID=UPI0014205F38|nr:HlyD family efflux transporter periplasmic adaptor subunit [Thalassoroseus pseudoceratinae]